MPWLDISIVLIGPPTFSIYPCIAVVDVESLTLLPTLILLIEDAWLVVVIPTFSFLGRVVTAFGFNLAIFPLSDDIGEL